MNWTSRFVLIVLLVFGPAAALGQAPTEPTGSPPEPQAAAADEELGQAIRNHYLTRLRSELSLTDEQMNAVTPLVEQIERTRARLRRERGQTAKSLQQGMEKGASDVQLQGLLDHLEAIDEEQRVTEASVLVQIDELLTVRQRVQFRFYTERFRRNLERRINDLQRERRGGRSRGPANRQGLPPEQP